MRLFILMTVMMMAIAVSAQSGQQYMTKMAIDAGIKLPIPAKFASSKVRNPIRMDSLSLTAFRHKYYATMEAGTILLGGGTLLFVTHILIAALRTTFNQNLVISIATVGVTSMTAGSITLPIGASKRHRYKRSLRVALAQSGM